jgi:ATP-dependent DNA ligase
LGDPAKKYWSDASTMKRDDLMEEVARRGASDLVRRKLAKNAKDEDGNPKDLTPKRELIRALQLHHVRSLYGDAVPKPVRDSLVYRPMLPKYSKARSDELAEALVSDDWVAERKVPGYRVVISSNGSRATAFSRYLSDADFMPMSHSSPVAAEEIGEAVIDAEIVGAEGLGDWLARRGYPVSASYEPVDVLMSLPSGVQEDAFSSGVTTTYVVDVMELDGRVLVDEMLGGVGRRAAAVAVTNHSGLELVPAVCGGVAEKLEAYRREVDEGREGLVLKNLRSKYEAGRRSGNWLKLKRLRFEDTTDTLDAFVTGWAGGDVATVGVYRPWDREDSPHEVGRVRIPGGDTVASVGDVLEIAGSGGMYRHLRMCPYKKRRDCVAVVGDWRE